MAISEEITLEIAREYQRKSDARGGFNETYKNPQTGKVEHNSVMMSVRLLNRLIGALQREGKL